MSTKPMEGDQSGEISRAVSDLLAGHEPEIRAITLGARALVREVLPGLTERVDPADYLIAYGRSMKVRDLMIAIAPHAMHVNVQLADGALLADPGGIVEGTGKRIRHVKCRSMGDIERPALRALLLAEGELHPI